MESVPLSIVIVNTSHRDLLRQCLDALARAELPEGCEIVVVDNASADGSADMVDREYPHVRLIRRDSRRGPAFNYNRGFETAKGEYLLVLNEDAEVTPDALMRLYCHLQTNPRVAIAAPRLIYPDGTPQRCCNRFPGLSTTFKRLVLQSFMGGSWVHHQHEEELRGRQFEPDWIMATSLMIRRSAMDEVGPYDEQFEIYYEETDLAKRLRDAGWTVAWVPEAVVKHHHGVSNVQIRGDRDIAFRLMMYRSRYRYFRKRGGPLYSGTVRAIETALFALYWCKTAAESLVPSRRAAARLKSRLYGALALHAALNRGCPDTPPS